MKALIQRVVHASVSVDGVTIARINQGIIAYIGIGHEDTFDHAQRMVDKVLNYRIFSNEHGKLDNNLMTIEGELLLISQFTLMALTSKGRRPDFKPAMPPQDAQILFDKTVSYAKTQYSATQSGQFGADMQVESINDGPINFLLEIS